MFGNLNAILAQQLTHASCSKDWEISWKDYKLIDMKKDYSFSASQQHHWKDFVTRIEELVKLLEGLLWIFALFFENKERAIVSRSWSEAKYRAEAKAMCERHNDHFSSWVTFKFYTQTL